MDVRAYNLLDDFRISGHWWLPATPERKIPGTITVNPDTGVRLELVGRFDSPEFDAFGVFSRNIPLDIVLGADSDGAVYTLHKVDMLRISSTSSFRVSYLLAGTHFSNSNELLFGSALVQYTYLEAWSCFNFTRSGKSDSPDFFSIQVPINLETLFRMGGAGEIKDLSLVAHALWRQSLSVIDIKPSARFKVDLNAPADLRTFFQLVNNLGQFMTLLIGEPCYAKKLQLCTSPDTLVDVFYPSTIRPEKKLHPAEMCFTLTEIQKIAPMLVEKWFASLELLAPIYDLLFGTLFDPDSFVRTKFVNLTQALESFHRRTEGGTYISSGEFAVVRDALRAAVPSNTSDPLRRKLLDSIGYSNEYSLRKRLKELFQSLDRTTVEMLKIQDVGGTVEQLVRTRNYLTHFNEEQKTAMANDVVAMHYMNERLTALLFVLIMRRLGISEGAAARSVLKRRYFQ